MRETVNVLLARFESEQQLGEFFDEQYDDDDDVPISQFAESQGTMFYDHDWLEVHFDDDSTASLLRKLPGRCAALVEAAAESLGIDDPNCVILFHDEWPNPKSSLGSPSIWHMGEFNNRTLSELRPTYEPGTVESEWWTDFPASDEATSTLRRRANDESDPIASAKLGALLLANAIEPAYEIETQDMIRRAQLLPVALHECLLAVAAMGHADVWLELFSLTEQGDVDGVTHADCLHYLERAADLGSSVAQFQLASLLMYE